MVLSHTVEPVGVGCPNPSGEETSAPTMDAAPQIVPPFAPEERYVYSSATCTKHNKAPEGRHVLFV